jgi:hypothetical protein
MSARADSRAGWLPKYLYLLTFSFYSAASTLCGTTVKYAGRACGEFSLPAPLPVKRVGGRLEPMTVLTAEDPTVLAGLINPQGRTTEAELEVA